MAFVIIVIAWNSSQMRYSNLKSELDESFPNWVAIRDISATREKEWLDKPIPGRNINDSEVLIKITQILCVS